MEIFVWDGRQISKPGIYSKIPLSTYHRPNICAAVDGSMKMERDGKTFGPSVSSSGLRIFNPLSRKPNSPAHFWARSALNPAHIEEEDTDYFILGRALHHLILSEPFFNKLFCERPDTVEGRKWDNGGWGTTAWKRWVAERKAEGRSILSPEQIHKIRGMALRLGRNPEIGHGLLSGMVERSMFWIDRETGLWLKGRPDSIPRNLQFGDLKITGTSVRWFDMQKSIEQFGYYQQAALVAEGCQILTGETMQMFSYAFVEHKHPHCVDTVEIKDNDLKRGYEVNRVALRKIAHGLRTGEWPGPGEQGIRPIEMRERAQKIVDDFIKFGEAYDQ